MPSAARSDRHPGGWERSMLRDQLVERGPAIDLLGGIEIEIDRPHSARGASWRADHRIRVLLPPREDLRLVPGRIFEAVGGERLLVDRIARKDRNAATYIVERGLGHSRRARPRLRPLRLRAHSVFPPSLKNKLCRYLCWFGVGSRPKRVREAMSSMKSWCRSGRRCFSRCRKSATSVHSSCPSVLRNSPVPCCLASVAFTPSA